AYDALPAMIELPEYVCGDEVAPTIAIQNMGNEELTSLDILYSVNGGPAQTYDWTGSLVTGASTTVTLPAISFSHMATNTFWVATSAPNGQTDMVAANDIATKEFLPAKNSGTTVNITIVPDNYGSETTWRVKDPNGNVIESGGPYSNNNNTPINVTLENLANGCHTFEIDDSYGDGICCAYGQGSFTISSGGTTLYNGGEFGSSDERIFNVGGVASIEDEELVGELSVFPNPFADNARVNYTLVKQGVVTIEVQNVLGATVFTQTLGEKAAGMHSTEISAEGLTSGVYLVNVGVNGAVASKRVVIAK
ncbi:MAG: T9SS type A sorting domain-containing protein, partial [Bacteroidetes bacterium]